ncbi:MAG: hypothetical protein Ta2A_12460 [Treponemataceae bacterium]|nr:MAG: hypothetical protein Ta2A_12460 [Treponemataceae bacterium]
MANLKFDTSLPALYSENWKESYRTESKDSPRLSSYQSPSGKPIPFIYKSIRFSGGQSVDTAEYPFFGLWSNEALNEKPQTLTINGFLRGTYYLQQRTALVDSLRAHTSDETPGFLDLPLWGRFPVVVVTYDVEEDVDTSGQCAVTLTLTRAGVPVAERAKILEAIDFTKPAQLADASIKRFSVMNLDTQTMFSVFGQIKNKLLSVTGIIQGAQTLLSAITNEITGITNLIAQGVSAPKELAQALVNAAFAITGGVMSIAESAESTASYFMQRDNKKNTTLQFLSESKYTSDIDAVTVSQAETKQAADNLYRTVCLSAATQMLMQMDDVTYQNMSGYWSLYEKLEASINLDDPDIYQTITDMRSTLSEVLRNTSMSNELSRRIEKPSPLLFIAHYLSCDDERLRSINTIEDSLLVSGDITYV